MTQRGHYMDEMVEMSHSIHIISVLAFILVLVIMTSLHKFSNDFKAFSKRIRTLMVFHLVFLASIILTGTIMMAVEHLSLTPATLLMIITTFIIASLEIKRNKALSKVIKFGLMPKMEYANLGFKYLLIELVLMVLVALFSRMSSAFSF